MTNKTHRQKTCIFDQPRLQVGQVVLSLLSRQLDAHVCHWRKCHHWLLFDTNVFIWWRTVDSNVFLPVEPVSHSSWQRCKNEWMPFLEIRDTPVRAWTLACVVEFSEVLFMSVWSTFDAPTVLPPACLLLLLLTHCLHSFVNLARPLKPICHVGLNHCWVLITLREQWPLCHRRNGPASVAPNAWSSCYVAVWWF